MKGNVRSNVQTDVLVALNSKQNGSHTWSFLRGRDSDFHGIFLNWPQRQAEVGGLRRNTAKISAGRRKAIRMMAGLTALGALSWHSR